MNNGQTPPSSDPMATNTIGLKSQTAEHLTGHDAGDKSEQIIESIPSDDAGTAGLSAT